MRKLIWTFAVFIVLIGSPQAAENEKIQYIFTTTTWSQYLGGSGVRVHHKPVQQAELFVAFPSGFYLDVWGSTGFDSGIDNFGKEVDYTVGYEIPGLNLGLSYFDLARVFTSQGGIGDVVQAYVEVSKEFNFGTVHTFKPFVKMEYYHPLRQGVQNGLHTLAGVNSAIHLTEDLRLRGRVYGLYDTGALGLDSGFFFHVRPELEYQVNNHFRVSLPKVRMSSPISPVTDGRKTEWAVGLEFRVQF